MTTNQPSEYDLEFQLANDSGSMGVVEARLAAVEVAIYTQLSAGFIVGIDVDAKKIKVVAWGGASSDYETLAVIVLDALRKMKGGVNLPAMGSA